MVVEQDAWRELLQNQLAQLVDAMHTVEVEAEHQLCLLHDVARTLLVLGEHHHIAHRGQEIQRTGHHVGGDHHGVLPQAMKHVTQCQRTPNGITIGRQMACNHHILSTVDIAAQTLNYSFIDDGLYHYTCI